MGLLKYLADTKCLLSLAMLRDVLTVIAVASNFFQKQNIDFSLVAPMFKSTINQLESYDESPGQFESEVLQEIDQEFASSSTSFQGFEVKDSIRNRQEFKHSSLDLYLT